MADLLKYRYVGERDANGVPLNYLTHPLYGGIPARDLHESDLAEMDAYDSRMAGVEGYSAVRPMLDATPLYAKVSMTEARGQRNERGETPPAPDGNVPSPGLPAEQVTQVAPPGSAAAGPTGEIPAGAPVDAEAQMAAEQASAATNPAIADQPPVTRHKGRG
jgi:hypothetical protein